MEDGLWKKSGSQEKKKKTDEWISLNLNNLKLTLGLTNWETTVSIWECGKLLNLKTWHLISFSQLSYRNIDLISSVVRFFEFKEKDIKSCDC